VVVSNRPGVRALEIAARYGVPNVVIEPAASASDRWEYDRWLADIFWQHGVTPDAGLILLAGFDRILSREFVARYQRRIMNIHPSLLPSFKGLHAQQQALEYGVKIAGCTVHFVEADVDAGPIITQAAVSVREDDDVPTLAARILEQEHRIYPEAVRIFVEGKLRVEGRSVRVLS
jgi:phosphoribosylglycinamide formyltransferase-1